MHAATDFDAIWTPEAKARIHTGLFLGMADTVTVGDEIDFRLVQERHRGIGRKSRTA